MNLDDFFKNKIMYAKLRIKKAESNLKKIEKENACADDNSIYEVHKAHESLSTIKKIYEEIKEKSAK
ncbi:hypothetical protein phi1422_0026 [Bdellovibrio phage phi1422]|uniref:hypothetical protein n=1 Tax=Bdellovibrio phage phi1422 TaxID=1127515 RepID=UPI0002536D4E|nr:hypothetical protein F395_gp26 [Bdellovibrio phage phi1422]AFC22546.1 hypothetical protein phi1422_0026 [Bdellovibrio phage phi1422]